MAVKSSISLTKTQDAFARGLVASGRFSSMSAVVQHALDRLQIETETSELEREALRVLLDRRRGQASVSEDDMTARIEALLDQRRGS